MWEYHNGCRRINSWIIAIIIAIIASICVFISDMRTTRSNGVLWQDDEQTTAKKEVSYISIPGFSEIYFEADTKHQRFSYNNPSRNNCIMDLELKLPNGEVLFEEDNIHPGYGIKELELNKELSSGDYKKCKLTIRCHSSDGSFYNGATLTVDLYVR